MLEIYVVKSGKKVLVEYGEIGAKVVRVLEESENLNGIKIIKCDSLKLGGVTYK